MYWVSSESNLNQQHSLYVSPHWLSQISEFCLFRDNVIFFRKVKTVCQINNQIVWSYLWFYILDEDDKSLLKLFL